jgi:hypothetical protein
MRVSAIVNRASWGIAISSSCTTAGEEFLERLWLVDAPSFGYCINLLFGLFRVIIGKSFVCVWGRIGTVAVLWSGKITGTCDPSMQRSLVAMLVAGGGTCIKWTIVVEHLTIRRSDDKARAV